MFYGSVPAEAQAIMNKIVKAWDVSDIYVCLLYTSDAADD